MSMNGLSGFLCLVIQHKKSAPQVDAASCNWTLDERHIEPTWI